MDTESNKPIYAALSANLAIAVAKYAVAIISGSTALFAEAVHSTSDTLNQILLLIGKKQAKKIADKEHPFGFGRERYIYSAMVAILLFFGGGMFALYESFQKIMELANGESELNTNALLVGLAILVFSMIAEGLSLRTAIKTINKKKHSETGFFKYLHKTKDPELLVIVVEDFTAEIGLSFATIGITLTLITGNPIFDVAFGTAIGFLLIVSAAFLGFEMKSLILGEPLSQKDLYIIRKVIEKNEFVDKVVNIKTMHIGPGDVLVGLKIDLLPSADNEDHVEIIDAIKKDIKESFDYNMTIFIEEDEYEEGEEAENEDN
jgi:cation diffusion facilitator family transporter